MDGDAGTGGRGEEEGGGGTRRKRGVGERTELATETVIWRPSQNGNVLCHSPLGDSLTGVAWCTLPRQLVTTRDTIEKIFPSFLAEEFFRRANSSRLRETKIAKGR